MFQAPNSKSHFVHTCSLMQLPYKLTFINIENRYITIQYIIRSGKKPGRVSHTRDDRAPGPEVLLEKLGGGVRPASQNPYSIYYQNLRSFLPYLWPDQTFDVLFMTVAADTVALNIMMKKELVIAHIRESPPPGGAPGWHLLSDTGLLSKYIP